MSVFYNSIHFCCRQQQKAAPPELVEPKTKEEGGDGEPGDDPNLTTWFKRMFKASLAFQLVILTVVCLSALFEPQCCDFMNNYSWSFSPKLHYDGRPPI